MKWWQRKLRAMKLGWSRGSGPVRKVSYGSPAGTFVQYSTVLRYGARFMAPVQETVVVDRKGLKQSEYWLWLN